MGHQLSGDTEFEYLKLKERTRRKRSARKLRGKAAECGPKAREESVLSRSAQPLQEEKPKTHLWNLTDAGGRSKWRSKCRQLFTGGSAMKGSMI